MAWRSASVGIDCARQVAGEPEKRMDAEIFPAMLEIEVFKVSVQPVGEFACDFNRHSGQKDSKPAFPNHGEQVFRTQAALDHRGQITGKRFTSLGSALIENKPIGVETQYAETIRVVESCIPFDLLEQGSCGSAGG